MAVVCTAVAGASVFLGDAVAEEAYFSVKGQITSARGIHQMFFGLDRPVGSSENLRFQTYTGSGGTNAAGDVITASGFDSVLDLFSAGAGGIVVQNDDGSTGRDSLLSWPGVASNGADVLSPDPLPALNGYRLTVSDFGNDNTGPWAVDLIGPADALTLTNLVPSAANPGGVSQVDSLKFGTRLGGEPGPLGPEPAKFNYAVGSTLEISESLVVANTGRGVMNQSNGLIQVTGTTRVETGGIANLTGGTLSADGGLKVISNNLSPLPEGVVNLTGGTLDAAGLLTIRGDSPTSTLGGTVNLNGGTIRSDDGTTVDAVNVIHSAGDFVAGSGSTLTIQNGGTYLRQQGPGLNVVSDQNIVVNGSGSQYRVASTAAFDSTTDLQNNASLRAENGGGIQGEFLFLSDGMITAAGPGSSVNFTGDQAGFVHLVGSGDSSNTAGLLLQNQASADFTAPNTSPTLTLAQDGSTATIDVESASALTVGQLVVLAGGNTSSAIRVNGGSQMTVKAGLELQQGSASITGENTNLSVAGTTFLGFEGGSASLFVGSQATASLGEVRVSNTFLPNSSSSFTVSGGSVVTTSSLDFGTGGSASSSATIGVSGTGSSLTQTGASSLTVGNNNGSGNATINVLNFGRFITGTGLTTINATGTVNNGGVFFAFGDLLVDGGTINGLTSTGRDLTVRNDGQVNSSNNYISSNTVSVESGGDIAFNQFLLTEGASINIDGAGSTYSAGTTVLEAVAPDSETTFFVRNNATASVNNLAVSETFVFFSPGESINGRTFFRVESGASVNAVNVKIAAQSVQSGDFTDSGTGSLTVTGTNSTFTQTGSATLQVGKTTGGTGTLTVENGGTYTTGTGNISVNETGAINVAGGTFNANGNLNLDDGTLNLTAGTLTADTINRNSGSFNFTGGTLDVDTFNGNLDQDGGILDLREDATGTLTTINGRYRNEGGTLALFATLGSTGSPGTNPLLDVNGLTQLGPGSTLQIDLNPDSPNLGDNDSIVLIQSAAGIQGTFDNEIITAPSGLLYEIQYTSNAVRLSAIAAMLAGDYNGNGEVDAADYTVWQDNFGSMINLAADGNGNGVVDAADYTIWQDNFGNTLAGSSNAASLTAIPEPSTLGVVLAGTLWSLTRRRQNTAA